MKRLTVLAIMFSMVFAFPALAQDEVREQRIEEEERGVDAERIPEEGAEEPEVRILNAREQLQERRAQAGQRAHHIMQRIEQVRVEKEQMLEAREERLVNIHEQARERLNEQMQNRIEQLAERLNMVNGNMTDAYLSQLNALYNIFERAMVHLERASGVAGADLSAVYEAADHSLDAINSAREAVLEQKSKIYTGEVESAETMGEALRGMIQQFRTDHQVLRDEHLFPARESVRGVLRSLQEAVTSFRVGDSPEEQEEEPAVEQETPEEAEEIPEEAAEQAEQAEEAPQE